MTLLTERFSLAVEYARAAHDGQVQKSTRIPYITHLLGVASLVLEFGGSEDQAIAGLLHDVLEDCGFEHEAIIRERFGDAVADMVKDCTDGSAEQKAAASTPEAKRADWWKRKLDYLEHLRKEPETSLLVGGCDKLYNARCIVRDLRDPSVGIKVFERFTAGREGTLRYYESIYQILASRKAVMASIFEKVVEQMHDLAHEERRLPLEYGVYWLKIYSNYHYMDEDETYLKGPYWGSESALVAARAIVDVDIDDALAKGKSCQEAMEQYKSFGEDPVILGSPPVEFSGWNYAAVRCACETYT